MKHTQAVFSVKFEPIKNIRDYASKIEPIISDAYMCFTVLPVPETVLYDMPRMTAESKSKHSRLSVSLLSVDIVMNFDDEFSSDYAKVESYIRERALLAKKVLETIGVKEYLYLGVVNNIELDTKEKKPIEFMRDFVTDKSDPNAREITLRTVVLKDDKYFVAKQYMIFERYDANAFPSAALISFNEAERKESGVALSVDVNSRFGFSYHRKKKDIAEFETELNDVLSISKREIQKEA